MSKRVSNWGNFPVCEAEVRRYTTKEELQKAVREHASFIPRGNGRCYGDSSLNASIISTLPLDKMLGFDKESGVFTCQGGVRLDEILDIIVPEGFFLPVTPGTKFVTVGGAVAADVHGKNHHKEGSFSRFVHRITLLTEDGSISNIGPERDHELFSATCGGMGLTGLILEVSFSLKPIPSAYIRKHSVKTRNLEELFELFESKASSTYSMAWIDPFRKGKGIASFGEHAGQEELPSSFRKSPFAKAPKNFKRIPFHFPSFILNRHSIKIFNTLYYKRQRQKVEEDVVHFDPFFYPLDGLQDWNRIYGKRGFTQYQFVLPKETSYEGILKILDRVQGKGPGSFLTVLKLLGPSENLLSFPMEGYTLALDLPLKKGVLGLLDELDEIVEAYGGRLYLAKDARTSAEHFQRSYPSFSKFQELLCKRVPEKRARSLQSKRLGITP